MKNKDLEENEVIKNNVKRNLPNNVAPQEVAAYSDILIKLGGRNDLSDKDVLQAFISDIESESHTQHEDMQHEEDKIATQVLSELEEIKNSLMEMIDLLIEEFNSNAGFTPILGQPEPGVLTKELLRDEPCHEDPLLAEEPVNWGLNEYMEAYEIKMNTLTKRMMRPPPFLILKRQQRKEKWMQLKYLQGFSVQMRVQVAHRMNLDILRLY